MRVGEDDPLGSQPIHVRRLGLWIAFKRARPVIQIIDGDEQDIWLSAWLAGVLCSPNLVCRAKQQSRQQEYRCLSRYSHCKSSLRLLLFI